MATTISDLVVRISADVAQLHRALAQTERDLASVSKSAATTGAAVDASAKSATTATDRQTAAIRAQTEALRANHAVQRGGVSGAQGDAARAAAAARATAEIERQTAAEVRRAAVVQRAIAQSQTAAGRANVANFGIGSAVPTAAELAMANRFRDSLREQATETAKVTAARKAFNTELLATRLAVERAQRSPLGNLQASLTGSDRLQDLQAKHVGVSAPVLMRQVEAERALEKANAQKTLLASAGGAAKRGGDVVSVGFLAAMGLGVREAIAFESAFTGMRKTIKGSEAELNTLQKQFEDLSTEVPVTFKELAKIGELAGQLGVKKENIAAFARVIAELGVSTNLTSERAATDFARLANIMKLPQSQFRNLGSTIVQLGNNFATTERDILSLTMRLAGAGHAINMPVQQVLAFATAMSSVGIRAEMGGTAMSRFFMQTANAVAKGGDDLKRLATLAGMSGEQFKRAFTQDSGQAINAVIVGLGKMKDSGQSLFPILTSLGVKQALQRDVLLRLAGAGDVLTRSLAMSGPAWEQNNALAKEAALRFATTESQLKIFNNEVKLLGAEAGRTLIPALRQVVHWLSEGIKVFRALPKETQANIVTWGTAAAALWLIGSRVYAITKFVWGLRAAWLGSATAARLAAAANVAASATSGAGGAGSAAATAGLSGAGVAGGVIATAVAGGFAVKKVADDMSAAVLKGRKDAITEDAARKQRDQGAYLQNEINAARGRMVGQPPEIVAANLRLIKRAEAEIAKLAQSQLRARAEAKAESIIASQAGAPSELAASIVRHAGDAIKTPAGQASCAYFASEVMRAAGANVPKTGGAAALRDYLVRQGAVAKPGSQAQPGDLLSFHGKKYGAMKDASGAGDHSAIYLGGGMMRQSSGGVISTRPFRDVAHATAYTLPESLRRGGGGAGGGAGGIDALLPPGMSKSEFDRLFTPPPKEHKLTEAEKEAARFKKLLAEEQAKLNEAMAGGDKAAQSFTSRLVGLTGAHKAQLLAVHEKVLAENKAAAERRAHAEVEERYHERLAFVSGKIREGREQEVTGLAKVQKEFKGLTAAQYAYLLQQEEIEKSEEKAREAEKKKAEEVAKTTAHFQERLADAKAAWEIMQRPPAEREVLQKLGNSAESVRQWEQLTQAQKANMLASFSQAEAYVKLQKDMESAEKSKQDANERAQQKLAELRGEYTRLLTGSGEEKLSAQFMGADLDKIQSLEQQMQKNKALVESQQRAKAEAEESQQRIKAAAEQSEAITRRLGEGLADVNVGLSRAIGPGNAYNAVLARMNLATRDLTEGQRRMVQEIARKDTLLATVQQFAEGTRSVVQNMFQNLMQGGRGFFSNMIQGFTQMFQQIAVQFLTNQAMSGLMRLFGGSLAGLGGLGGGSLPGIAGPVSVGLGGLGGAFASVFGGGFAGGGRPPMGRISLVGERGPELFIPDSAGRIVPTAQAALVGAGGGSGGGGHTFIFNITTPDVESFRKSSHQLYQDAFRQGERVNRR